MQQVLHLHEINPQCNAAYDRLECKKGMMVCLDVYRVERLRKMMFCSLFCFSFSLKKEKKEILMKLAQIIKSRLPWLQAIAIVSQVVTVRHRYLDLRLLHLMNCKINIVCYVSATRNVLIFRTFNHMSECFFALGSIYLIGIWFHSGLSVRTLTSVFQFTGVNPRFPFMSGDITPFSTCILGRSVILLVESAY